MIFQMEVSWIRINKQMLFYLNGINLSWSRKLDYKPEISVSILFKFFLPVILSKKSTKQKKKEINENYRND